MADAAMPHMSVREGTICGVPTRLFRMSFNRRARLRGQRSGRLRPAVWEALWSEGRKHGACAYGTEAMHVLRAEKGYKHHRRSGYRRHGDARRRRTDLGHRQEEDRLRRDPRPEAARIWWRRGASSSWACEPRIRRRFSRKGRRSSAIRGNPFRYNDRHETSSYWSGNCGRSIALALVAGGRERIGIRSTSRCPTGRSK